MYLLALRLTVGQLKQKVLSRLLVVASTSVLLVAVSLLALLAQSFTNSMQDVAGARFMTAYLDVTEPGAPKESQIISAIQKTSGVVRTQFVSRDVVTSRLTKQFPELQGDLGQVDLEAVPSYVKIWLKNGRDGVATKVAVEKLHGVDMVEMNTPRFEGILKALAGFQHLIYAIMAGLVVALVCIMANHFKLSHQLAVQTRRTLKVLGAKRSILMLPFALEGLVEGVVSGLVAAGVLVAVGQVVESQINGIAVSMGYMSHPYSVWGLATVALGCGVIVGVTGSLWAARRVR